MSIYLSVEAVRYPGVAGAEAATRSQELSTGRGMMMIVVIVMMMMMMMMMMMVSG